MSEAVGVFDSGVGGLTVFRELKACLPSTRLLYLGDTARTPYGSKGPETIKRYAQECASFLLSRGISQLVVACNTASSHALPELRNLCGSIPVFGTIDPAVDAALAASRGGSVLVLGTRSTIRSGAFQSALAARSKLRVQQEACPLFVPLVEESIFDGRIVDETIAMYLEKYRASDVDTVILGCTHYPLLRDALQRYFGDKVTLVDCASTLAAAVAHHRFNQTEPAAGSAIRSTAELRSADEFFVSDDPASFSALAAKIVGHPAVTAERVLDLAA